MSTQLVNLEKLQNKLESDHKSNKTFSQYVLLPALQNLVGAFALGMFLYICGFIWFDYNNPFQYEMFKTWVYIICGIVWAVFTMIYTLMDEVRILSSLMIVYRIGYKAGSANKPNISKVVDNENTDNLNTNRGIEQLEDIKTILTWHYQTGKNISRDALLTVLAHRDNSKRNTEQALNLLFAAGIIEKGPNRNDPILVKYDNYNKAINQLREYLKNKQ